MVDAGVSSDPDKARVVVGAKSVQIRPGWIGAGVAGGWSETMGATEMRGTNGVSPGQETVE